MNHIRNALVRGGIPLAIMLFISDYMSKNGYDPFQVKSVFFVALISGSVGAASVIYDMESLSLSKQSMIHFAIMLLTVFPCLILSGWFPLNGPLDYLKILGIFVFVGLIMWTVSYFIFGKLLNKKNS